MKKQQTISAVAAAGGGAARASSVEAGAVAVVDVTHALHDVVVLVFRVVFERVQTWYKNAPLYFHSSLSLSRGGGGRFFFFVMWHWQERSAWKKWKKGFDIKRLSLSLPLFLLHLTPYFS